MKKQKTNQAADSNRILQICYVLNVPKENWGGDVQHDSKTRCHNVGLSLCHANAHFKLQKKNTQATIVSNKSISIYSVLMYIPFK